MKDNNILWSDFTDASKNAVYFFINVSIESNENLLRSQLTVKRLFFIL